MLPRSVLFYTCDFLILGLDICDSDSNLVRRNICKFRLLISFSVLFRTVQRVLFCVWVLLWCLLPGLILGLPVCYSSCFFRSFMFCCICSTTFSTCKSFSFSSFSHNFVSVIDVMNFDISISVLKSGNCILFLIRIISLSGLPVFPYLFLLPKKISSWVVFVPFRYVISVV